MLQNKRGWALMAGLMLVGNATAVDDKYQALEEKIAQLESMLMALKEEVKKKPGVEASNANNQENKTTAHDLPKHDYAFGGFIKATGSYSAYSDGDLASGSAGRDFYIPGTIPVGGEGESSDFDLGAKESRINFKSSHQLANGKALKTFVEMDFLLSPGGDERVSNSYNPRLRHAYFTYDKWLFGQTWSTFQDVGALPESVDFLAASDGIVFERQSMVRYTNGPWQVAVENPETTITPFGGGGRIVSDDGGVPDFVVKYTHKGDWGHLAVAGLMRQLSFDQVSNSETDSSFGVSVTGKVKVGSGDLRINLASGEGMGRYVGINTANGAVISETGDIEAIGSTAAAIAYRHLWNERWRSNFILSAIDVDNDVSLTGMGVTKSVESAQVNLMYSPEDRLTFGVGFLHGKRTLESNVDGELNRLIFSAKYSF